MNKFSVMTVLFLLSSSLPRGNAFRPALTNVQNLKSDYNQVNCWQSRNSHDGVLQSRRSRQTKLRNGNQENSVEENTVPLLLSEGIFAVYKPLDWTSSDVVSFLRGMLMRESRERGANPVPATSRKNKKKIIKVGHGGTLDPLATGVLVIGVGKGTKELQGYLSGSKKYSAEGELGFETNTLDMDIKGNITKTAAYDHVTRELMEQALPPFRGTIQQIPPIFSALKRKGKKMYEAAREGATEEDLKIPPREVEIHMLELLDMKDQKFSLDIECGGGTYVRSLIRDLGYAVDSVATMTALERTKQAQFTLENCLVQDDWSPENIYAALDKSNAARLEAVRQAAEEAEKVE